MSSLYSKHPNIGSIKRKKIPECQREFCTVPCIRDIFMRAKLWSQPVSRVRNCTAQDSSQHQKWTLQMAQASCTSKEDTLAGLFVSSHSDLVAGGYSSCHLGSLFISGSHGKTEHPLCPKESSLPSKGYEWQGRNTS